MSVRVVRVALLALAGTLALAGCGQGGTRAVVKPQTSADNGFDPTFVEPKPAPGGVVLKLDPKADVKVKNELRGEIEVSAVPGKPSIPEAATGKSVLSMQYTISVARNDPSAVVLAFNSTPLKLEGKANGEWMQQGGQKGEVKFDHRGALLDDPESLFDGLFGAGMVAFPEAAVAEGSTWSSESSRNMPPFGEVRISETFTYRGTTRRNGVLVHQIDSTATGSMEEMKSTATYYITEDGLPYEATMTSVATAPIGVDARKQQIWARFVIKVNIFPQK